MSLISPFSECFLSSSELNPKVYLCKPEPKMIHGPFDQQGSEFISSWSGRVVNQVSEVSVKSVSSLIAIIMRELKGKKKLKEDLDHYTTMLPEARVRTYKKESIQFYETLLLAGKHIKSHTATPEERVLYNTILKDSSMLLKIGKISIAVIGLLIAAPLSPIFGNLPRVCLQHFKNPIVCKTPDQNLFPPENAYLQFNNDTALLLTMNHNIPLSEFEIMNVHNSLPTTELRTKAWLNWFDASFVELPKLLSSQEIFDPESADILSDVLKDKGYYVAYCAKPANNGLGMGSGLFLASLMPIKHVAFKSYYHRMGPDRFANKGLLGASIEIENNVYFALFNTHSQAGLGDVPGHLRDAYDHAVNIGQNNEVDAFTQEFDEVAGVTHQLKILMGDLNKAFIDRTEDGTYREDNDYKFLENLLQNWENLSTCKADLRPNILNEDKEWDVMGTAIDTETYLFQYIDQFAKMHENKTPNAIFSDKAKKIDFLLVNSDKRNSRLTIEKTETAALLAVGIGKRNERIIPSDHRALLNKISIKKSSNKQADL